MRANNLQIASEREFLRILVGSGLHGTAIEGQDDRDEMGIFIEPPTHCIGLASLEHVVHRTAKEGQRSGPDDLDLTLYSLRKWMRLALNGNPTVILPLFVPLSSKYCLKQDVFAARLQAIKSRILSQRTGRAFLGYMRQQKGRLTNERGGRRKPARPELVEAHGFDTKYAMHIIRLGHQGRDLLNYGELTLPLPEGQRALCLRVRCGEVPLNDILHEAQVLEDDIAIILGRGDSPLPKEPDREWINEWLSRTYIKAWEERGDIGI